MKRVLFALLLLLPLVFSSYLNQSIRFGDGEMLKKHHHHISPDEGSVESIPFSQINVHLIPHTHDDVGWLKTLDEYFYGSRNDIQNAQVQYVLDTVIQELENDPTKRFIYVEMAFFTRWWNEQTKEKQESVKRLVDRGQLEFINGGWCMNDEAAPYYEDVIDQMTLGHQFLKETFNKTVEIGWHIDPFGHSSSHASLFSQMGFDAFFFARIDYQDKEARLDSKSMEMIWNPPQASGDDHSIFTVVNYYHYEAPPSFCFDQNCEDQPIMDDPRLEEYNLDERSKTFVTYFKNMALHYRHADLLHTMGSDFQYSNARKYFKNVDKLIKHINSHPEWGVNIFYSTPSNYIKTINKEPVVYPIKTDDFWPYADVPHGYWTGYFVSRVAIKGIVKETGRFLQSVRTLFALTQISTNFAIYSSELREDMQKAILELEEAMGILQHHDAVAGTSKQQVAGDYMYIITKAIHRVRRVLFRYLGNKNNENLNEELKYTICNWNLTSQECPEIYNSLLNGDTILLTTYNPAATRQEVIRAKVPALNLKVLNSQNERVPCDVICSSDVDQNDCTLIFVAELKHQTLTYFKITEPDDTDTVNNLVHGSTVDFDEIDNDSDPLTVQAFKSFKFENRRSLKIFEDLNELAYFDGKNEHKFKLSYNYYRSYQLSDSQPSGAYIFRPDNLTINGSILYNVPFYARVYAGKTVLQISIYGDRIKSDVRLFRSEKIYESALELETFVDSIPIDDGIGKEITLNVRTSINNNHEFYTDTNGLEMQKRKINYRPTWNLNVSEPVSGNYYPINAIISINNSNTRFSILNDRSQGGSSYNRGEIEIMIHRRLLNDDWRGVGEPLNETEQNGTIGLTQRMRHYLLFSNISESRDRKLQYILDTAAITVLANNSLPEFLRSPSESETALNPDVFPMVEGLKIYVKDLKNGDYLLRLMNIDERESKVFTLPYDYEELSLTAVLTKEQMEAKKLHWYTEGSLQTPPVKVDFLPRVASLEVNATIPNYEIEVKPLEIKTFKISGLSA